MGKGKLKGEYGAAPETVGPVDRKLVPRAKGAQETVGPTARKLIPRVEPRTKSVEGAKGAQETVGPTARKLIPRVEPRTKKAPAWGEVKESDVIVEDRNGSPIKIGSIVEIIEIGDSYKGLLYVVGIEAGGGRSTRLLLALGRWDKWDFKASPSRVSLRCYEPVRGKGE